MSTKRSFVWIHPSQYKNRRNTEDVGETSSNSMKLDETSAVALFSTSVATVLAVRCDVSL